MPGDIYCIDASSLMELPRQYPRNRFPSLWKNIEELVDSDRLIAPMEVLKEIQMGDDSLVTWANKRKRMFKKLDVKQTKAASEILAECTSLIDPLSEAPQADPFLIALAEVGNKPETEELFPAKHIVITQEGRTKPNKIPQVCARRGIDCMRLLDLIERENWRF